MVINDNNYILELVYLYESTHFVIDSPPSRFIFIGAPRALRRHPALQVASSEYSHLAADDALECDEPNWTRALVRLAAGIDWQRLQQHWLQTQSKSGNAHTKLQSGFVGGEAFGAEPALDKGGALNGGVHKEVEELQRTSPKAVKDSEDEGEFEQDWAVKCINVSGGRTCEWAGGLSTIAKQLDARRRVLREPKPKFF